MPGRASYSKGFTLVEIMIVVMIMGILGMLTFPTINSWTLDRRISRACQIMMSGIEYAASLSTRHQRPFEFQINTGDNRFEIVDTAPYPDAIPPEQLNNQPPVNADGVVLDPFSKEWYVVDFDLIPDLENLKILSGPSVLSFDAIGNAPLTDSTYVLSVGGQTRTIQVDGISGHITVY